MNEERFRESVLDGLAEGFSRAYEEVYGEEPSDRGKKFALLLADDDFIKNLRAIDIRAEKSAKLKRCKKVIIKLREYLLAEGECLDGFADEEFASSSCDPLTEEEKKILDKNLPRACRLEKYGELLDLFRKCDVSA